LTELGEPGSAWNTQLTTSARSSNILLETRPASNFRRRRENLSRIAAHLAEVLLAAVEAGMKPFPSDSI
jgi:hypothetical protein